MSDVVASTAEKMETAVDKVVRVQIHPVQRSSALIALGTEVLLFSLSPSSQATLRRFYECLASSQASGVNIQIERKRSFLATVVGGDKFEYNHLVGAIHEDNGEGRALYCLPSAHSRDSSRVNRGGIRIPSHIWRVAVLSAVDVEQSVELTFLKTTSIVLETLTMTFQRSYELADDSRLREAARWDCSTVAMALPDDCPAIRFLEVRL